MGIKECWHFKTAKAAVRYMIGWGTPQDRADNFSKITTHNCHTETGSVAFYDKLPEHLRWFKEVPK